MSYRLSLAGGGFAVCPCEPSRPFFFLTRRARRNTLLIGERFQLCDPPAATSPVGGFFSTARPNQSFSGKTSPSVGDAVNDGQGLTPARTATCLPLSAHVRGQIAAILANPPKPTKTRPRFPLGVTCAVAIPLPEFPSVVTSAKSWPFAPNAVPLSMACACFVTTNTRGVSFALAGLTKAALARCAACAGLSPAKAAIATTALSRMNQVKLPRARSPPADRRGRLP